MAFWTGSTMTEDDKCRDAAKKVEKAMLDHLIQWTPAQELKVSDIIHIAFLARQLTFDALTERDS